MFYRKVREIVLGVATFWPGVYLIVFLGAVMFRFPEESVWNVIAVIHTATTLLVLALMAYYVIHLIKNEGIDPKHRMMWIVGFVFANVITMPCYYVLFVRGRENTSQSRN